jgi:uncharacterized membrane-anchored protein YitT (DUF2179 family)
MQKSQAVEKVKYWLFLNLGIILLTFGVYFFKTPNGFATGGVSGLSIILFKALPYLTQAEYMTIINVLLLFIGLVVLGKGCGIMTIYCSLLFSAETRLLELLIPLKGPLTDQPFLELIYAILLTGIGSAIIFNCDASSGGTDIVALILKKYSSLDVGKSLLISDFLIAVSTVFVFGIRSCLFSVLGLFVKAFLIDNIIESINLCKSFTIITTKPEKITDYIMNTLHHGVTAYTGLGEFTHEPKTVLMTVCKRIDAAKLKNRIKDIDPDAFVIVTNSSEIIGRGFRGV